MLLVGNKRDLVAHEDGEQEQEQQQQARHSSGTLASSPSGDCGVDADAASGAAASTIINDNKEQEQEEKEKPSLTKQKASIPAATPKRQVSREEAEAVANVWQCPFLESSAKNGENVKEMFTQLVRQVHKVKTSSKKSKKEEKKKRKTKRETSCLIL